MIKHVQLTSPASERPPLVFEVRERDTAGAMLATLASEHRIQAEVLQKNDGSGAFDPDDLVWPRVDNGETLLYGMRTEAGAAAPKPVTVVFPAGERPPLAFLIRPDTEARSVLATLGRDHGVSIEALVDRQGRAIPPDARLWPHVAPGDALYCVVGTCACVTLVTPSDDPLHVRRGWRAFRGGWVGWYHVGKFRLGGEARRVQGDLYRYFARDLPAAMRRHPKWGCFSDRGNGWFAINMNIEPRNLDEGIAYVERLVAEVLRGAAA